jgi:hypothetical protein
MHALAAHRAELGELKRKLTDYEQPPIESGDLQSLLKRHAFLQTKCAALERENEQLKARIAQIHGQAPRLEHVASGFATVPPKNNGVL